MNCLLRNSRRLLLVCKQAGAVRRLASLLPSTRSYCSSHANTVLRFNQWYRTPRTVAAVAALASGAAAMAALGRYDREVVPYTNRTHMVIRSPQSERQLWEFRYAKEKKIWASESRIVDPIHPDSIRVRRIAEKIIGATYRTLPIKSPKPQTSHLEGFEWEVILVKGDIPSAECRPGGKIAVYTGLLDRFTDAEIAFAIAHEIGHIVARHYSEICYAKWCPPLLFFPFLRRLEMEADHIGTLLLGAAGFHPYASFLFFRQQAIIGRESWVSREYIPFYPSDKTRAERVLQPKIMEEAMKLFEEAPPDEGTSSQATGEGFSFPQTLGDAFKLISTRLRHALTGESTY